MMQTYSVFTKTPERPGIVDIPFSSNEGQERPEALLTLRSLGSMRFRWDESNPHRDKTLRDLCSGKTLIAPHLLHSQTVFAAESYDSRNRTATGFSSEQPENRVQLHEMNLDGIITTSPDLVPSITVADCMPIYLWEPKTRCFGLLHSGWRGTGIVANALYLAEYTWGSRIQDFYVTLGPHIHDCCYTVDEDRAEYFSNTFGTECVSLGEIMDDGETRYRLSLAEANRLLLTSMGIPEDHILHCMDCTACDERLGSFRRETAHLAPEMSVEERQ
jgi:YfiH family protein